MYDLGFRIKEIRTRRGLNQKELAQRINKSKSAVCGYEQRILDAVSGHVRKLFIIRIISEDDFLRANLGGLGNLVVSHHTLIVHNVWGQPDSRNQFRFDKMCSHLCRTGKGQHGRWKTSAY